MSFPEPRTIVAVDVGNSYVKAACFCCDSDSWTPEQPLRTTADNAEEALAELLGHVKEPCLWSVSAVHRGAEQRLAAWVANRPDDTYHRLAWEDFEMSVEVRYPHRVGIDRLAAAAAARELRQTTLTAIIDAGSAVTVDWLSETGEYLGGAILPGMRTQMVSLVRATDQLPTVAAPAEPPPVIGKDTEEAIRCGVYWGVVGAVRELTERQANESGQPAELWITGGDGAALARHFPTARSEPHLVLIGAAVAARRFLRRHPQ